MHAPNALSAQRYSIWSVQCVKDAAFAPQDLKASLTFDYYWPAGIRSTWQSNLSSACLAKRCAGKWKGNDMITIGKEAATLRKFEKKEAGKRRNPARIVLMCSARGAWLSESTPSSVGGARHVVSAWHMTDGTADSTGSGYHAADEGRPKCPAHQWK
jgi:hypothetical protein